MISLRFGSCVLAGAVLMAASTPRFAAQAPIRGEVTSLRASVTGPGTVEIRYDLASPRAGLAFDVSIVASEDGGVTFPITLSSVSGDVGTAIMPGAGKRVVWNAARDVERAAFDKFQYRISAIAPAPAAAPRPGEGTGSPAPAEPSRGGGGTKWLLIGGGAAAAGAVAALAGGGSSPRTPVATTPTPPTRAVVTATAAPNPVPFSGSPITHAQCVNVRNTWIYTVTLTETAGVAATFDRVVDRFNAVVTNDLQLTYRVSARGSTNIQYSWCSEGTGPHLVETTFTGTDAGGNPISATVPSVTLLPRAGTSLNASPALRRSAQGAGGPHPQ